MMTVPLITVFTGDSPNRNTQDATTFTLNSIDWLDYQLVQIADTNTAITEINNTATTINNDAIAAANSAASAATSADNAAASANFVGAWVGQTGAANKPYSVSHKGDTWLLENNLADVTTSEPGISSDWFNADSTKRITHNRYLHFYRNR
jgi:hypothetical protein